MNAEKPTFAHLYAIAVRGAYAYEGELRTKMDTNTTPQQFDGAHKLPVAAHSNQRDTLLGILAALDRLAEMHPDAAINHVYIRTNIKGQVVAWGYNHPYWDKNGVFVRKDNSPIANADLWEKILEHHKRVPITFMFEPESNSLGGMRMRTLKVRANATAKAAA